ncbi:MAG: hypothetical protein HRU15_07195 [Planctomycetes bacterium]|nr:hypothetical protein [Planctomycetota bacterium]
MLRVQLRPYIFNMSLKIDGLLQSTCLSRQFLLLHFAGFVSALLYANIALCSEDTWLPISTYLYSMLLLWLVFLGAWKYAQHHIGIILFWAIIFRCIAFSDAPLYEDDFNRYQWDGHVFLQEGNPYDRAPADYFSDHSLSPQWANILSDVNNPEFPTVYGPLCQYIFVVAIFIGDSNFYISKFCIVIFELWCLWLLSRMLSARQLMLYAWMPLLIQEVWFSAHSDAIALPFLLLSMLCFRDQRKNMSALFFACAICARLQLIVLAPLFFVYMLRAPRTAVQSTMICILCCLCMYAPFILQGSYGGLNITWMFVQEWYFNAFVFDVLSLQLPEFLVHYGLFAAFICGYALLVRKILTENEEDIFRYIDLVLLLMLLCGTCINPWYAICILPCMAYRPRFVTVGFCALMPLAYIHGIALQGPKYAPYEIPTFILIIELVFLCILCACDYKRITHNAIDDKN